jgi:hypothetical protein
MQAQAIDLIKLIQDEARRLGLQGEERFALPVLQAKPEPELRAMLNAIAQQQVIDYSTPLMHLDLLLRQHGLRKDSFAIQLWLRASGFNRWEDLDMADMRRLYRDLRDSRDDNVEQDLATIAQCILELNGDRLSTLQAHRLRQIVARTDLHERRDPVG